MYSLNSSGNNTSGNSGFVSYSIGQVFFSSISDNAHQVVEGIQIGYQENTEVNENEDADNVPASEIEIVVFPNPTVDFITIASEGFDLDNQLNSYQLYNYQGKLLKQHSIQENKTEIDLSNLSSSIYILQVFVEEKLSKTFKIIKR
tara:strand:- start:30512 stop:30949 length:438 start_codon:yes stop_codon:yes gene_type:complete